MGTINQLWKLLAAGRVKLQRFCLFFFCISFNFFFFSPCIVDRTCQKEDRGLMAEEYCQYKNLKAKLRLLEALLSKPKDSTKTS